MSDKPEAAPELSIIIAAYNSHDTIRQCLEQFLAQTARNYEIIVVDSGPSNESQAIITTDFPAVQYLRSAQRLYPHEARNFGTQYAQGDILVFTDPDAYPPPNWLDQMCVAHRASGQPVISSVACYGEGWWEMGLHFSKFDKWLPGGPARIIDIGPTVGFLCPRRWFDELGGFSENPMLADTVLSWELAKNGHPLWFAYEAVIYHHHIQNWTSFVRERYSRGHEFGVLRSSLIGWSVSRLLLWIIVSVLPIRLMKLVWRGLVNAHRARLLKKYLWTLPIVIQGQSMWLLGEVHGYVERLRHR